MKAENGTEDESLSYATDSKTAALPSQTLWETGDENQKVLTWFYVVAGGISVYVVAAFYQFVLNFIVAKVLVDSAMALSIERFSENFFSPAYVVAVMTAVFGVLYCRRTAKVNQYGLEVVAELRKVTWSTWDATWKSTLAVVAIVLICAAILGVFDWVWGGLSGRFLR